MLIGVTFARPWSVYSAFFYQGRDQSSGQTVLCIQWSQISRRKHFLFHLLFVILMVAFQPVPRSMRIHTAPGSYNIIASDFDNVRLKILKQKKMAQRSGWAQNIAFTSTETRFNDNTYDNEVPAPSTYYPKVGIADTAARPNVRGGAFGSKDDVSSVLLLLFNVWFDGM